MLAFLLGPLGFWHQALPVGVWSLDCNNDNDENDNNSNSNNNNNNNTNNRNGIMIVMIMISNNNVVLQMMEVCRRPAPPYPAAGVSQAQALPPSLMPNYVHSTNGSVTLTFNNQITNQVCRRYSERVRSWNGLDNNTFSTVENCDFVLFFLSFVSSWFCILSSWEKVGFVTFYQRILYLFCTAFMLTPSISYGHYFII